MTEDLKIFLQKLTSDFSPIVEQATKYADKDSRIREDGTAEIFRRPWVASQNYGLWLFAPANEFLIYKFVEQTAVPIPEIYRALLLKMNGCHIYELSLFGLPPSLYIYGVLDRSSIQQYDLGTANRNWVKEYNTGPGLFHIGSRSYSYSENIGYFIKENKILSIRKNGKILKEWNSVFEFLKEEIGTSEKQMLKEAPEDIKILGDAPSNPK
jgi:hypothetical protein